MARIKNAVIALAQFVVYIICHDPFRFFLRGRVQGLSHILSIGDAPCIVVANHPTKLDPFLLTLLPLTFYRRLSPLRLMTAEYYYNKWWLRPLLANLGCFPVPERAWTIEEYLGEALRRLVAGGKVLIFPEGKTTHGQRELPKPGVAYLASQSHVKILPVYVDGIAGCTWLSFLLRRHQVNITFGDPFFVYRAASQKNLQKIAVSIMDRVYALRSS